MYWDEVIQAESFQKALSKAYCREGVVYPSYNDFFRPFDFFKPEDTKVVILGQDPYHNGTADGLAFSSRYSKKIPPSLRNILKMRFMDLHPNIYEKVYKKPENIPMPESGDLTHWAEQGVLLLNTSLTVEEGKPNSHTSIWNPVVKLLLEHLRKVAPDCLYLFWGKDAQNIGGFLPNQFRACHPSPLVRNSTFLSCKHFSLTNKALNMRNITQIKW